eukprot:TRINITY_DN3842_c0_g1_i2.p1 TRINITY_DN3842_c0_g1~~TRINITY_DN3842_c0_g1_i2.p1  ORF type:complete len:910 (+),score=197.49 TRINITY_DN3842_c0_g1_i2:85-2814(+)
MPLEFLHSIERHFSELRDRVAAEHDLSVSELELHLTRLQSDNAALRQKLQHEDGAFTLSGGGEAARAVAAHTAGDGSRSVASAWAAPTSSAGSDASARAASAVVVVTAAASGAGGHAARAAGAEAACGGAGSADKEVCECCSSRGDHASVEAANAVAADSSAAGAKPRAVGGSSLEMLPTLSTNVMSPTSSVLLVTAAGSSAEPGPSEVAPVPVVPAVDRQKSRGSMTSMSSMQATREARERALLAEREAQDSDRTRTGEKGVNFEDDGTSENAEDDFQVLACWTEDVFDRSRRQSRVPKGRRSQVAPGSLHSGSTTTGGPPAIRRGESNLTEDAVEEALPHKGDQSRFMLAPSSKVHLCWEFLGLLLITLDFVLIPVWSSFGTDTGMGWPSVLSGIFWTADIAKGFCTGYLDHEGFVEMQRPRVARRYLRSWFGLDLPLVLCEWVSLLIGVGGRGLNLVRFMRVVRLLRLLKAAEIESFIREHIRSETTLLVAGVARTITLLLALAHLIACGWYALGLLDPGPGQAGWVAVHHLEDFGILHKYGWSMHWSLAQFIGENLFELRSSIERCYAIFVLLFAFLFSTLFISSVTTAMTRLQIIAGTQSSQMSALRRYLCDQRISTSLAVRMQRNVQHAMDNAKKHAPEASIVLLEMVSEPLRIELHFEVRFPILKGHPFFDCYEAVNEMGLRKVCHEAVTLESVSRGDVVYSSMEVAEDPTMVFVFSGELEYAHEDPDGYSETDPVKVLKGDWTAEGSLWTKWSHCGTLRCSGDLCTLLQLSSQKWRSIVKPFPTDHARRYAASFVEVINSMGKSCISDLPTGRELYAAATAFPEDPRFAMVNSDDPESFNVGRSASIVASVFNGGNNRGSLQSLRGTHRIAGDSVFVKTSVFLQTPLNNLQHTIRTSFQRM